MAGSTLGVISGIEVDPVLVDRFAGLCARVDIAAVEPHCPVLRVHLGDPLVGQVRPLRL